MNTTLSYVGHQHGPLQRTPAHMVFATTTLALTGLLVVGVDRSAGAAIRAQAS